MSKIEWTDQTWNPVTGCTKVSPGCANCYAERQFPRNYGSDCVLTRYGGLRLREFGDVECHEDRLDQPLRWRRPRRIFVCSMGDLFHEDVPAEFIWRVFRAMASAPQHTFQVLTKRPERMKLMIPRIRQTLPDRLEHIWLGVSVEDQQRADERIPLLKQMPAAIRFVSCEPLLGPIALDPVWLCPGGDECGACEPQAHISWVIVGGESGPRARPCDVAWVRSIVEQCKAAGVACFTKQLGANVRDRNDAGSLGRLRLKNRKGGDPAEWPEDLRVREWPC
jgi:protein gp37